jgi:hypothetical protein
MRGIGSWLCVGLFGSLFVGGLGGCAAPAASLELGHPPEDFAFSLFVFPTPETDQVFTPASYIVEPDRMLRVALGDASGEPEYPAPTRILTHTQFERLWNLALESGLLDLERADVEPEAYRTWYVRQGQRRQASFGPGESTDLQPLIEELERLAWLRP